MKRYIMLRMQRSKSGKKKELQTQIAARLQPWLDFAALSDFGPAVPKPWDVAPELTEAFLEAHGGLKEVGDATCATRFPANFLFPFGVVFDRPHAAKDFYEFFWTVRSAFEWLVETWANPDQWPKMFGVLPADSPGRTFSIPTGQQMSMNRQSGLVHFTEGSPAWMAFKWVVDGVELERLVRCPVCRRIYYAVRKDKGACDEHLGLARVWDTRGKLPEYNAARKFRRKAGLKGLRGKARKDLVALNQSLRQEKQK
jgi:hypothetical protein